MTFHSLIPLFLKAYQLCVIDKDFGQQSRKKCVYGESMNHLEPQYHLNGNKLLVVFSQIYVQHNFN